MPLTTKELSSLEEQLGLEQNLVQKYTAMSEMLTDTNLKNKCKSIARKHQKHFDKLYSYLN